MKEKSLMTNYFNYLEQKENAINDLGISFQDIEEEFKSELKKLPLDNLVMLFFATADFDNFEQYKNIEELLDIISVTIVFKAKDLSIIELIELLSSLWVYNIKPSNELQKYLGYANVSTDTSEENLKQMRLKIVIYKKIIANIEKLITQIQAGVLHTIEIMNQEELQGLSEKINTDIKTFEDEIHEIRKYVNNGRRINLDSERSNKTESDVQAEYFDKIDKLSTKIKVYQSQESTIKGTKK